MEVVSMGLSKEIGVFDIGNFLIVFLDGDQDNFHGGYGAG